MVDFILVYKWLSVGVVLLPGTTHLAHVIISDSRSEMHFYSNGYIFVVVFLITNVVMILSVGIT